MPGKTIRHGTRAGYRAGCHNRSTCPGGDDGLKCIDANNKYNQEYRDLRKLRQPGRTIKAGSQPRAGGLRVSVVDTRSEPPPKENRQETWPQADIPLHDPPESLVNAQVQSDPEPAEAQHDIYNQPEFIVTPQIKRDVEGKLGLFAALIGMPFEAIDPFCGRVFADNVDSMINAYVPLILRSPAAVKFLTSTSGGWLEWVRALQATWPVIQAIYAHHLARTVGRDTRPMPDATMPPGGEGYEYSAA